MSSTMVPQKLVKPVMRRKNSSRIEAALAKISLPPARGATESSVASRTLAPDLRITNADVRAGIVSPDVYDKLFLNNFRVWVEKYRACPLGLKVSKECDGLGSTFNVFPPRLNPVIEWSDTSDTVHDNVIGEVVEGAVLDLVKLPFLKHDATLLRPTLLMFTVTGHVMAAIYFRLESAVDELRGELHILNPWPLSAGGKQQIEDVYTILKTVLNKDSRNIRIVDVAEEVQTKAGSTVQINLQEDEKVGFCTLWVGILSHGVLTTKTPDGSPSMTFLQNEVTTWKGPGVLSPKTLQFYDDVYDRLLKEKALIVNQARAAFGDDKCYGAAAAQAAVALAKRVPASPGVGSGGKRIRRHRTFRKRKLQWNSHRAPQSMFTTSRRRTRKSRRGGKDSSTF